MQEIQHIPQARLCNSTKEQRSEFLENPSLPLLLQVLRPAKISKSSMKERGKHQ